MTTLLNNKPVIGAVSGMGSGFLYSVKTLLTDDGILKYVAGAGIYLGAAVAVLTLFLRALEIRKNLKKTNT